MHICEDCGYPFESECRNPACRRVNPEAWAQHVAESEAREAERLERERIRRWARRNGFTAA